MAASTSVTGTTKASHSHYHFLGHTILQSAYIFIMTTSIHRPAACLLAVAFLATSGLDLNVYALGSPSSALSADAPGPLIIQAPDNICGYIEGSEGE